jgi:hypothetical protein
MRTANGGSGNRLFGKRFDENVVLVDRDAIRWLGRRFVDSMVLVDSCGTPDGPLCVRAGTGCRTEFWPWHVADNDFGHPLWPARTTSPVKML